MFLSCLYPQVFLCLNNLDILKNDMPTFKADALCTVDNARMHARMHMHTHVPTNQFQEIRHVPIWFNY